MSTNDHNDDEVARLQRVNNDLEKSLQRCRDMLHDYQAKLAANCNEPKSASDGEDEETREA